MTTGKIDSKVKCKVCGEKLDYTDTWTWNTKHSDKIFPEKSMDWICSEKCEAANQL